MKKQVKEITIKKTFITDRSYEVPYIELLEVLEALEDAVPGFGAILISSTKVEDYLLNKDIIYRSARGGYVCKDQKARELLLDKIQKTPYE